MEVLADTGSSRLESGLWAHFTMPDGDLRVFAVDGDISPDAFREMAERVYRDSVPGLLGDLRAALSERGLVVDQVFDFPAAVLLSRDADAPGEPGVTEMAYVLDHLVVGEDGSVEFSGARLVEEPAELEALEFSGIGPADRPGATYWGAAPQWAAAMDALAGSGAPEVSREVAREVRVPASAAPVREQGAPEESVRPAGRVKAPRRRVETPGMDTGRGMSIDRSA